MRARTLLACLPRTLRPPPGRRGLFRHWGRDTALTPVRAVPSLTRPAGTVPRGALEAEGHQEKCH